MEKIINGIKYLLSERKLTAEVIRKRGYSGDIVIPDTVVSKKVSYKVTDIGCAAFENCKSLTSITIPNSVTTIWTAAFKGCTSLTSITIPDSVTSIKSDAFSDCTSLTSISIPNSVTKIHSIFKNCTSLVSITIPDSATSIERYAFRDCKSLTTINIPNSVISIGLDAFEGCESLSQMFIQEVEFDNLRFRLLMHNQCAMVIGSSLENIESLNIPAKIDFNGVEYCVTTIGEYAFCGCESLTTVTIPNSVTSIEREAFYDCESLTSINIPNKVTSIGDRALFYCTSLPTITIPGSVKTIGAWVLYECKSLKSITFEGAINQWKAINIAINDNYVVHCTDGDCNFLF